MNKIDKFVADFKKHGWDSQPLEQVVNLIDGDCLSLFPLAKAILDEIPSGGTFLDALFSHLGEEEFSNLITIAATPRTKITFSEAEESVFAYASLQYPRLLTPYLRFLFNSTPNAKTYYRNYPWRGADDGEIDELIAAIEQHTSIATARDARDCLLQTREPRALRAATLYHPLVLALTMTYSATR
jgi:hypothetical protein